MAEDPITPPTPPTPPSNLVPVNIDDEMRRSYVDYAMSVIIGRALPDVRDGLKPVHRRILFGMREMGLASNRAYRKCAKIVGEVMGNYHPHGDGPIYDTLVRMAQDFSYRYTLVDGQGNFGSVDGDPPAAMRYTEARMAPLAEALLEDIDRDTVDFVPNYDEEREEPAYLPSKIPNLLVNGSGGIAVGMATNMPPHNLTEICEAVVHLIENPGANLKDVMERVPGPDFPTGGFIYGRAGIRQAYQSGRGQITMRARAEIERMSKDRDSIIITEIPYQVNKARLIEKIAELVTDKRIDGISDIRDESDRHGMRIVVELKRGEQSSIVLNNLFKLTQMQSTFGVINLSIVNGQPRVLNLLDLLRNFVEHRVDVVRRRTRYELRQAEARAHILEGLQKALDHIDAIITLIRAAKTSVEARDGLIREFEFTEIQAKAILEMQLQRLTGLERQKILDELAELRVRIAELKEILASDTKLREVIIKELREVQKKYGDERRTRIVDEEGEINIEDLIAEEDVVITVSRSGYLKRTPLSIYRNQGRGGKGRIGMRTRDEDAVTKVFVANTHSYMLVFTDRGRLYWLKVYEIPDVGSAGKGKAIVNLANLLPGEEVRALLSVKEFAANVSVVMATRKGTIKKTSLESFSNPTARGIIAMGVPDDDELIAAELVSADETVFIGTHDGMCIRFPHSDVREMGRQAYGVIGIRLDDGDYVVAMIACTSEEEMVLTVTEGGFGKRTRVEEYRPQGRGGKGIINVRTTDKNGKVVAIMPVNEDSDVLVMTANGKLIRVRSTNIRAVGRATQGVRLIQLDDDDKVTAATLTESEGENGNGNGNGSEVETPPTIN
ncbi:MAG TPA: DNA gyrase subunit A [Terriglobia bacterium]|nr:DNA gyrase subunit A [Terriglobia bacterium]